MDHKRISIDAAAGEGIAALLILACDDGSLKQRLIEAWTVHLSKLHDVQMPPEFQKRFDAMLGDVPQDELIIDAIENLSPEGAQMLAHRIVHFVLDMEMVLGAKK
ncbi:MAG: hypothetical protein JST12_08965 [Armatimonadetes bacterium]|nr:hypothetical protein [Armatimonadota bacterium]